MKVPFFFCEFLLLKGSAFQNLTLQIEGDLLQ